jgi:hypothetical protein
MQNNGVWIISYTNYKIERQNIGPMKEIKAKPKQWMCNFWEVLREVKGGIEFKIKFLEGRLESRFVNRVEDILLQ